MRILFGRKALTYNSINGKKCFSRHDRYYAKGLKIAILVLVLIFSYLGPFKILCFLTPNEARGTLQSYRTIWTSEHSGRGHVESSFELTIDDKKYKIVYKYLDVSPRTVENMLWNNKGREVSIEYIPDQIFTDDVDFLIRISSNGEELFNSEYLGGVWIKESLNTMLIGLAIIMVVSVIYLMEIGYLSIVHKEN